MKYVEGTKVYGIYYGNWFSGVVKKNRLNYRSYLSHVTIALDSPITVFSKEKKTIIFDSLDEDSGYDMCGNNNVVFLFDEGGNNEGK